MTAKISNNWEVFLKVFVKILALALSVDVMMNEAANKRDDCKLGRKEIDKCD